MNENTTEKRMLQYTIDICVLHVQYSIDIPRATYSQLYYAKPTTFCPERGRRNGKGEKIVMGMYVRDCILSQQHTQSFARRIDLPISPSIRAWVTFPPWQCCSAPPHLWLRRKRQRPTIQYGRNTHSMTTMTTYSSSVRSWSWSSLSLSFISHYLPHEPPIITDE